MIDRASAEPSDHRVGLRGVTPELPEAVDLEVLGAVPAELRGTLYRIGPGAFTSYGDRHRHWFDGDGMAHAISLGGAAATYRCRFVEHSARLEERAADRRLYGGFGTAAPGGPLRRFLRRGRRRNPANTHIIRHAGRLLALCEAGRPWRLDPETLETLGEEDMGGALPTSRTVFTAHPRLDPATGELWGFGVEPGRTSLLHIYRWPSAGPAERFTSVPLPRIPMIHDFAVTATTIVVLVAPVVTPPVPLALMLGQRAFGQVLRYRPELGARIALIDRQSGECRWVSCPPFLFFHVANAHDDGDELVVDLCAYADDALLAAFSTLLDGPPTRPVVGALQRLRISRRRGAVTTTTLADRTVELPRVVDGASMRPQSAVFGVTSETTTSMIGRPIRVECASGAIQMAPAAAHEWASELIPVAKAGARDDGDAWILTVVLDGAARTSELRILDGGDLGAPAVARVRLPQVVPLGFHGSWVAG